MSESDTIRKWKNKKKKPSSEANFKNYKKQTKILKRKTEKSEIGLLNKKLKLHEKAENLSEYLNKFQNVNHFHELPISQNMTKALSVCKFQKPTIIQKRSLPITLRGDNLIAAAKTGSGKTLSFVVPILEDLYREEYSEMETVAALVLAPTRELAQQIQLVFKRLIQASDSHNLSCSAITGGSDMYTEASLISRNQIIVATPGRLLQHLEQTVNFDLTSVRTLVLDEADRMLDHIFKDQLSKICDFLPPDYQTLLFSATGKAHSRAQFDVVTKRVKKKRPLHLITDELEEDGLKNSSATSAANLSTIPEKLQQILTSVKAEDKLSFLYNFLKSKQKQKILIFASTCKQVGYLHEIFQIIQPGTLKILQLRGSNKHIKRKQQFDEFVKKQSGVLIATDIAARGLDVSKTRVNDRRSEKSFVGKGIDWVVHFDTPDTIETYIHRSGRTARAGSKGKSLLMCLPEEVENCQEKFKNFGINCHLKNINSKKLTLLEENLKNFWRESFFKFFIFWRKFWAKISDHFRPNSG